MIGKGVRELEFYDEIYVGESVFDLGTICYALRHHIPVSSIYCLCTSVYSPFPLEIFSTIELLKKRNQEKNYKILGIAGGQKEAFDLLCTIIEEKIQEEGEGSKWIK